MPGWGPPAAPPTPPPAAYGEPADLANDFGEVGAINAKALGSKEAVIAPKQGWRRGLYVSTFKLINPGESPLERLERDLRAQTARVITGTFIFAIYNPKGGSTKTTNTAGVGLTFANVRGTEVIVIDANPNKGKLAARLDPTAQSNHREMLRAVNSADEYHQDISQVRSHTGRNGDLDVLPGVDDEMENPVTYTPESLLETISVLRHKGYKVIGIDCGNSSTDPVTRMVLNIATALIVPAELRQDSVRDAKATFKWLGSSGRAGLLGRSFLMLSDTMPKTSKDRLEATQKMFEKTIWKEPIVVPFDRHLEPAGEIKLDQLQRETRRAYLKATAKLSQWYGLPPVPVVGQ
ncbi:AAA family ATPase [Mycobacteroides abscessus]|nr:AAA family ATPase [Mycobacteroides abscessus]